MFYVNQLTGFGDGGLVERIKFVGGNVGSGAGAGTGDRPIPLNSGLTGGLDTAVSNGDLVIAAYCLGSNVDRTLDIRDASGVSYTLVGSELYSNDTYDTNLRVCYKFVNGVGVADTDVIFMGIGSLSEAWASAAFVFRGVDQTTPFDVTVVTSTGINSILANPPSITPITAGAYVVSIGAGAHNDTSAAFYTTPIGLTGFQSIAGGDTYDAVVGVGYVPNWYGGTVTPGQFGYSTADNTSYSWAAMSLALRPA